MVDDGFISQSELDSLTRPVVPGFSIPTMTVTPNGGANQETVNDGPYSGLYALVRNYDITTRASDSMGNASRAVVTVKAAAIPIFQFGVFYEKDLEITNGARLDMQGWVHTNGNLYARSGGGLYLHNIVTTPNKFRFRRKDGANPAGTDQVYIDDAGATARQVNNDSDGLPTASAFKNWSETRFSGRLKTNAYGVDSLRLPLPTGVPPEELIADRDNGGIDTPDEHDSKFAWKADFYMVIDYAKLNNRLCDGSSPGLAIQYVRPAGKTVPTQAECQLIFSADTNKWWESREQTFVDEITIDYARLFAWMAATSSNQSSIMYITVKGSTIPVGNETYVNKRGCPAGAGCSFKPFPVLKIVNASALGRPFTLSTNLPIYVQGNYNSDVNWQPSALIGDAFTWLSPGFSTAGILNRPAGAGVTTGGVTRWNYAAVAATANTTIYAAILAGHGATPYDWVTPGATPLGCNFTGAGSQSYFYGGGLENFPASSRTGVVSPRSTAGPWSRSPMPRRPPTSVAGRATTTMRRPVTGRSTPGSRTRPTSRPARPWSAAWCRRRIARCTSEPRDAAPAWPAGHDDDGTAHRHRDDRDHGGHGDPAAARVPATHGPGVGAAVEPRHRADAVARPGHQARHPIPLDGHHRVDRLPRRRGRRHDQRDPG